MMIEITPHVFSVVLGTICLISAISGLVAGWCSRPCDPFELAGNMFFITLIILIILGLLFLGYIGITGQLTEGDKVHLP